MCACRCTKQATWSFDLAISHTVGRVVGLVGMHVNLAFLSVLVVHYDREQEMPAESRGWPRPCQVSLMWWTLTISVACPALLPRISQLHTSPSEIMNSPLRDEVRENMSSPASLVSAISAVRSVPLSAKQEKSGSADRVIAVASVNSIVKR